MSVEHLNVEEMLQSDFICEYDGFMGDLQMEGVFSDIFLLVPDGSRALSSATKTDIDVELAIGFSGTDIFDEAGDDNASIAASFDAALLSGEDQGALVEGGSIEDFSKLGEHQYDVGPIVNELADNLYNVSPGPSSPDCSATSEYVYVGGEECSFEQAHLFSMADQMCDVVGKGSYSVIQGGQGEGSVAMESVEALTDIQTLEHPSRIQISHFHSAGLQAYEGCSYQTIPSSNHTPYITSPSPSPQYNIPYPYCTSDDYTDAQNLGIIYNMVASSTGEGSTAVIGVDTPTSNVVVSSAEDRPPFLRGSSNTGSSSSYYDDYSCIGRSSTRYRSPQQQAHPRIHQQGTEETVGTEDAIVSVSAASSDTENAQQQHHTLVGVDHRPRRLFTPRIGEKSEKEELLHEPVNEDKDQAVQATSHVKSPDIENLLALSTFPTKDAKTSRSSRPPTEEQVSSQQPRMKRKDHDDERCYKTNEELVKFPYAYAAAYNAHDFTKMAKLLEEFCAEDMVGRSPFLEEDKVGRAAYLQGFQGAVANRPDIVHKIVSSRIVTDKYNHGVRFLAVKLATSFTRITMGHDVGDEWFRNIDRSPDTYMDTAVVSPEEVEKAMVIAERVRRTGEMHRVKGFMWFRYNLDDHNVIVDVAITRKFTSVELVEL